jgi:hypothetical protein
MRRNRPLPSRPSRGETGSTNTGCVAIIFILILAATVAIIYFGGQGLTNAGKSFPTVKGATSAQKKDYLKAVKKQAAPMIAMSSDLSVFVADVRKGVYKNQVDVNKKAMDIENRMTDCYNQLHKLKVPADFTDGHRKVLTSISSFYKCLVDLRKLNNVVAGNMDQIEQRINDIDNNYRIGSEQLSSGLMMLKKKQRDLGLGRIL